MFSYVQQVDFSSSRLLSDQVLTLNYQDLQRPQIHPIQSVNGVLLKAAEILTSYLLSAGT